MPESLEEEIQENEQEKAPDVGNGEQEPPTDIDDSDQEGS